MFLSTAILALRLLCLAKKLLFTGSGALALPGKFFRIMEFLPSELHAPSDKPFIFNARGMASGMH
jgi:hypothetical protein